jgi:hypothetical protein
MVLITSLLFPQVNVEKIKLDLGREKYELSRNYNFFAKILVRIWLFNCSAIRC